jgi:hypothetical protein
MITHTPERLLRLAAFSKRMKLSLRASDAHVDMSHRPALNRPQHHTLSPHAGRLSHTGAQ